MTDNKRTHTHRHTYKNTKKRIPQRIFVYNWCWERDNIWKEGNIFFPELVAVSGFITKRVFAKPRCSFLLRLHTSTLIREARRKANQNHFREVSFHMWDFWHHPPFDGSKCCTGVEGLPTGHIHSNDVMETLLVYHTGRRPQWEQFRATKVDSHYFHSLSPTANSKKSVSCSVVSNSSRPMDHSLPSSSVHGILQARTLEWVAIPLSRGSSWLRDQTQVSCIAGRFCTVWATREVQISEKLWL